MKGRADEWSNQYTPIMEVAVIVFVVAVVLFDVFRRRPSRSAPSSPRSFEVDLRDRDR